MSGMNAIVLGGTADHILLLQKLRKRGFHTILLDYLDSPPAREYADSFIQESTLDSEAVLQAAVQRNAALVVAACIDQSLLTMAYVCEKLHLPCHLPYATGLSLTNKAYMKKIFHEHGVPTSDFFVIEADSEWCTPRGVNYPAVVKPSDANSSKGVIKVYTEDGLRSAVQDAMRLSRSGKVIIEEFISGNEYSADVILENNKASVLMITQSVKSPINENNFTITQSLFDRDIYQKYTDIIRTIAEKIGRAFGINSGPLLIQLIISDEGVSVIEFSSRIGGGSKHDYIMEMCGFDILEYYLEIISGTHLPCNKEPRYNYGAINYLYAAKGTFQSLEGQDYLLNNKIIDRLFVYKTRGSQIIDAMTSSDRVAGYLILDNNRSGYDRKMAIANEKVRILNENGEDIRISI